MISEEKLNVIRDYLQKKFPQHSISDYYDSDRIGQNFYLEGEDSRIFFSRSFLDDSSNPDISTFLESKGKELERYLRREDIAHVIVTNQGIKLEKKKKAQ